MRRKTYLITTFLILTWLVTPLQGLQSSLRILSHGIVIYQTAFSGKGVNYMSLWNWYSDKYTSDDILRRDFSKFQQDGIEVICLWLYWTRLEGDKRGDYNGVRRDGTYYGERFLDEIKRISRIASEYGLKVLVSFHTIMNSPWSTPDYVIDPLTGENTVYAVIRSEEMRQAYIDMFNHTIQYLAGTEGIWAWSLFNEPWYYPRVLPPPYENINQKENFITLFQELAGIVKEYDGRSVTIKFTATDKRLGADGKPRIKDVFISQWGWDQRIFDTLDFISFGNYIPVWPELHGQWINITTTQVNGCYERGEKVWVASFGFESDDDAVQEDMYKKTLKVFEGLPIEGWIAFCWEADTDEGSTPLKGWNLCANTTTGEARKAYHTLITSSP